MKTKKYLTSSRSIMASFPSAGGVAVSSSHPIGCSSLNSLWHREVRQLGGCFLSIFRHHYLCGLYNGGYRITLLEIHFFGALPCDYGFDYVLANLDCYVSHDGSELEIGDIAA